MKQKATLVEWNKDSRKEKFLIVSKAGFTPECIERMNEEAIMHWDLEDVEQMLS